MKSLSGIKNFGIRGKGFSVPENGVIRTLKALHLLSATAWAGGALSLQALGYLNCTLTDARALEWIPFCIHFVDTWVVMPGLIGCILTGIFYSTMTSLGFFKYAWISIKWYVTIFAAIFGTFFWSGAGDIVIQNFQGNLIGEMLQILRGCLIPEHLWQGGIQLATILMMCLISVYRPLKFSSLMAFLPFGRSDKFSPYLYYYSSTSPVWFDPERITEALRRRKPPSRAELNDVLEKAKSLDALTLDETVALMRETSEEGLHDIFTAAMEVKKKIYGERIVLSAPLHVSNFCGSNCLYCAYKNSNTTIQRKTLNPEELKIAGLRMARQGIQRVFLVSGEYPDRDIDYLVETINVLYQVRENGNRISRINLNVGPLSEDEYGRLKKTPVGTVLLYQDTYHKQSYTAAHPKGIKSDFERRLMACDIAHRSEMHDTGLGIVLGLGPWQFDILGLIMHATHLLEEYGTGSRSVSMHRLRPAPGSTFLTPYPVIDTAYLRCVSILRLAIPYTSLILTSKETAGLWKKGCELGGSHLLCGSVANPYETWQNGLEDIPYPIGEDCHIEEIVETLLSSGLLPSFCTACSCVGRTGSKFISQAVPGNLRDQCDINSLQTLKYYLTKTTNPKILEMGEAMIAQKIAAMPEKQSIAAKKRLEKISNGDIVHLF